jgi:ABC-2 type transport system ATP-binding protein
VFFFLFTIYDSRFAIYGFMPDLTHISTNGSAAVSLSGLAKTYPVPLYRLRKLLRHKVKQPTEALRGLSLEIKRGEIFGLIGRNGAGKTTLTKIIATMVQPTSGAARVFGLDTVRDEQKVRSLVGLATAEERSFYWRLTVEQNLTFFARLYGFTDAETRERLVKLLQQFELEENRDTRFGELSTGNKQRVAFARAMLPRPPLLLLDEPTRSLDPLAAARMRELVHRLAQSEVTILLTSHNLAEIEELCGRVAVIAKGRIREIDAPEALRERHRAGERVTLHITLAATEKALSQILQVAPDFSFTPNINRAVGVFTRQANDETLDEVIRLIHQHEGRVFDVETERATLLSVMEKYEETEEKQPA